MHDIRASVILAKNITDNSIENIIKTLESDQSNTIWMYLTLKMNLRDEEEVRIGFDIICVDDDVDFGIELGDLVIGKTKDPKSIEKAKNIEASKNFIHESNKSVHPYDVYTIGQKFPPLPILDVGNYEFIVYEKYKEDNIILDTFQFAVTREKKS